MSEWSEIPDHLLELITEKMTDFEDILTFGLICKQWRTVTMICKETFMKKLTQQLPWLMFPPRKGSHLCGFYNLARRRIHQIPSWESNDKECFSSRGWLFTVGSDCGMNLLHPMTLTRFKLPGIKSFGRKRLSKPYVRFISRVILSASPSLASNFALVAIQGCLTMPAYWRHGDKRWTLIETRGVAAADAVFYQDKCYFISFWGKLLVTDFGTSNPTTVKVIKEFSEGLIRADIFQAPYLVILEGSLLLVLREWSQCFCAEKGFWKRPYQTINFQVFKFDFKSLSWEKLKNLRNWSIFLGENSSMALNASVIKGCKRNSIYFTNYNSDFSQGIWEEVGFDMGIFNVTNRTIEPLIEEEWQNRFSPPIFVDPTF